MVGMGMGATKHPRGTWFFLVVGAVIGLALGVLVSVATDVPLAPEAGLVVGALVGWLAPRLVT
jgi:membrane associated rhomboid family serine protease